MHPDSNSSETNSPEINKPIPDEETTGLPLLPTWRRVYWFVLVVFITYVVLLRALSQVFA